MARGRRPQLTAPPEETIPKVLSECQRTTAVHKRSVGLLQQCRRDFPAAFCNEFVRCITPALLVYKQEPAVTRTINFIATFASAQDTVGPQDASDDFVEELLGFLLDSTQSRDKALRYRSTQLVAKIIELLPEDAGISDEVWEGVCEHMQARLRDKQPVIRAKAAQALARLVEPGEDGSFEDDPVTSAYKVLLTNDKNSDVRKAVVASYPMAEPLLPDVIERTRDVSDAVRRVTYIALRTKLYVSRLSPQQRVELLRRGLSDRAPAVRAECVKMVCDYWYVRDCGSDPLALIDLLHVEEGAEEEDGQWSHEEVAERVLLELLRGGHATLEKGASLRDYLQAPDTRAGRTPGRASPRSILSPGPVSPPFGGATAAVGDTELPSEGPVLMSPSEALYWRVICQWLHKQAETQGNEAANSGGAQAEVLAAEADESRALLEGFLPATVAEFVELTRMHLAGGGDHRFAARQLMALAGCLDLTDAAGRRAAAGLVQALLCGSATSSHGSPLNTHQKSPTNPLRDCQVAAGPDLGTDRKWAHAVSTLARHVHAAPGEYVATLFAAVHELDRRAEDVEGTAGGEAAREEARLRCLAVAALLLEAVKGLPELQEADARATAVLEQAVAAQVHHASPHVRSAALRCLALLCHLDGGHSQQFSPLLCAAAQSEASPAARIVALKALFDVALRHGPDCLNPETTVEQSPVSGGARRGHPGEGSPGSAAESFQSALSSRGTSFRSAVSGVQAEELMETAQSPLPRGRPAQDESTVTAEGPSGNLPPHSDPLAFLAQFLDPSADLLGGGAPEKGGKRPKSGKGKKGPGKKGGDAGVGREAVEVAAEGFAKLLLFDRVPRPGAPLAQLLLLHFDAVTEPLLRLRQCLAVFFDYYAASAAEHKRSISGAFLDVVRLAWTGHAVDGKLTSAAARKRAATAAKFMLHLLQQPPLHQPKPAAAPTPAPTSEDEAASTQTVDPAPRGIPPTEDEGQEQLALDLAAEILGCPDKRSAGGKAYVSMLARSVAGLTFRRSEQEAIKRMRKLLDWLRDVLQFDKAVSKELAAMATRLAHLDDTPAEPLSDEALRSLQALAEAHARAADEGAEGRPRSRAKRTSKAGASDTTAVRSSNDEVTADRPDDVISDKRRAVRRPTRQSKTAALTRMGDQKKAAFAGDTDSSHESEDSGSEAFEGEDEGAASQGARTSQRHVGRNGGGSDSDEGSDDEAAEGRSGGVQKQQVQGGRRDSAGSAAGSEHGQGSQGQGGPQESDVGEGESDEDSGEPGVAAEERGSTERHSARVSGSVTSGAEESDDVSGEVRAGRPRRGAALGERRRRLVLEESSDEESGQGSAGEEEKDESARLVAKREEESQVTVSDSPKGAAEENASSDGDSEEVAPVVVRRKATAKRKVVLDSSEDEEEEADKGEVARHTEDSDSDGTSFSSAEEQELDSDSD